MSDNLSFTQSLRENGIIADADSSDETVETNNEINNENITKEEEINEEDITTQSNSDDESTSDDEENVFEGNTLYIGNKPVMNYVLTTVTQMNNGLEEMTIKARGRAISRAVDVAEIIRNRFINTASIESISTDTEEVVREDGSTVNVSTIEINISK